MFFVFCILRWLRIHIHLVVSLWLQDGPPEDQWQHMFHGALLNEWPRMNTSKQVCITYIYIYSDIFSIYAFDQAQLFWRGDPLLKMIQTISSMAAMSETNLGMSYVAFCSNRISIWKRFYCGLSCGWKPQHITTYSNIFQPQQVVDTQKTAPSWVQKSSAHWEAPLDGLYFLHSFSSSQVTMFARCLLQSPLVLCGRPPCS